MVCQLSRADWLSAIELLDLWRREKTFSLVLSLRPLKACESLREMRNDTTAFIALEDPVLRNFLPRSRVCHIWTSRGPKFYCACACSIVHHQYTTVYCMSGSSTCVRISAYPYPPHHSAQWRPSTRPFCF